MYERIVILPYHLASASAAALQKQLISDGIPTVIPKNVAQSRYKYKETDLLVNWGNSYSGIGDRFRADTLHHKLPWDAPIINHPGNVANATNKLRFFQEAHKNNIRGGDTIFIPPYTTEMSTAGSWLADGSDIVARKVLNGAGGAGLLIYEAKDFGDVDADDLTHSPDDYFDEAPLYTRYIKKSQEFRIHVANGDYIDAQRKAVRPGHENPNWQVRNLEGGFIYTRGGFNPPKIAISQAERAVKMLGLDFGAVDIIYNKHRDSYYVLEVNTAPGLTGRSLLTYASAIRDIYNGEQDIPDVPNHDPDLDALYRALEADAA